MKYPSDVILYVRFLGNMFIIVLLKSFTWTPEMRFLKEKGQSIHVPCRKYRIEIHSE